MNEFWILLCFSLSCWAGVFTWFATTAYNNLRAEVEKLIQR